MAEIDEDGHGTAAEWVLGTLTPAERAEAARRRLADPDFDAAVRDHERRLAPLLEMVASVEPPADLEARILARITEGGDGAVVVALRRRLRRWQIVAATSTAAAAALVLALAVPRLAPTPEKGSFVAVLQASGVEPAFIASVDLDRGVISVRRVGAKGETDKSLELWAVGGGRAAPVSLGLVDAGARIPVTRLGGLDHIDATAFAVSLEPRGGSPTGAPTGPVLWSGKLTPTE